MKPNKPYDIIAFDADDTLWQNERLYSATKEKFKLLLKDYAAPQELDRRLYQAETHNLETFGYGIKGFAFSMIETAIEISAGKIPAGNIQKIVDFAREMTSADVRLFEHVEETLSDLSRTYPLMIITKGDLLDQEKKIARSGLQEYFRHIEIVSEKSARGYQAILNKYNLEASRFMMVGNSLKSDILPVLELGGCAVFIPYEHTWAHELPQELTESQKGYCELEHIGLLPEFLRVQFS